MAGYEVEEARDGLEALHMIENRPPDLVVLDLMLHALDGVSVQQELAARAVTRQIPVVIVTGSTSTSRARTSPASCASRSCRTSWSDRQAVPGPRPPPRASDPPRSRSGSDPPPG